MAICGRLVKLGRAKSRSSSDLEKDALTEIVDATTVVYSADTVAHGQPANLTQSFSLDDHCLLRQPVVDAEHSAQLQDEYTSVAS